MNYDIKQMAITSMELGNRGSLLVGISGDRPVLMPMAEAVHKALDSAIPIEGLLLALEESQCPIVRQLRIDIADAISAFGDK